MVDRIGLEARRTVTAGLEFLEGLHRADAGNAHVAMDRFCAHLGFALSEGWLIDLTGGRGADRLRERRTLIPEAEAGIIYLLDRGDPAFAWAATQGRPWLMHPSHQLSVPDESEAAEAIQASQEIMPSRMNFAIPFNGSIRLTSAVSDMRLRDLEAHRARYGVTFALACYAVHACLGGRVREDEVRLSPRERECLTCLAAGLRNTAIAHRLSVTERTVEMHVANARRKLGARTREQALVEAFRRRLIAP